MGKSQMLYAKNMNVAASLNNKHAKENDEKQSKNKLAYLEQKPNHRLDSTA